MTDLDYETRSRDVHFAKSGSPLLDLEILNVGFTFYRLIFNLIYALIL